MMDLFSISEFLFLFDKFLQEQKESTIAESEAVQKHPEDY